MRLRSNLFRLSSANKEQSLTIKFKLEIRVERGEEGYALYHFHHRPKPRAGSKSYFHHLPVSRTGDEYEIHLHLRSVARDCGENSYYCRPEAPLHPPTVAQMLNIFHHRSFKNRW